jgi:transposase
MRQLTIGVDLGHKESAFAVLDPTEKVLAEEKISAHDRAAIREFLEGLRQPDTALTLVVEATTGWYWFVDFVRDQVDRVKLADPFWAAQSLRGRSAKNDRLDAIALARLEVRGQIQEGYAMSAEYREIRDLLRTRTRLTQERTAIKNRMRAVLRQHGIAFAGAAFFGPRGEEWLKRQNLSEAWRLQLVEQQRLIDQLTQSIQKVEKFVVKSALVRDHPYVALLRTIPGVGLIWSMTLALEIADISRFAADDNLVCFCGLAPTVYESGDMHHIRGLHKHRNNWLKGALMEVAIHAKKCANLRNEYARARKRYKRIVANIVVARKLARIIFAMLTRKENFRESSPKAARPA